MGSKSQAKMKARERVLAKEAAQRMNQFRELHILSIKELLDINAQCFLFDCNFPTSEIDNLVYSVEVLVWSCFGSEF